MPFALGPEDQLGPWIFYIVLACTTHAKYHTVLTVLALLSARARPLLFTLATCLAVASGAGFLVSLAWGNGWEAPEALIIAQRLILGATIGGLLLFFQCSVSWRSLYEEMSRPVWWTVTTTGGCGLWALIQLLPWLLPIPGAEVLVALLLLGFLGFYWSPTLLIPWIMVGTVDPSSRFLARVR